MKTKFLLFLALLCWGGLEYASAQITTGTPSSKVIRTGNRPEAGDFGVYLGATSDMLQAFDKDVKFSALPLLNFKYMVTDQFEARLGLELYKSSQRLNGDMQSSNMSGDPITLPYKTINSSSNAFFYPGFAYHFSSKNILDIYVGAEIPIGWDSSTSKSDSSYPDYESSGNFINYASSVTKRSFVIGLGAFVGIQAFIADLPLALGAEFGLSSRLDTGLKYKHEETEGAETQTYYTSDLDTTESTFDKLNARKGEIGGQVRLTLTYYFK